MLKTSTIFRLRRSQSEAEIIHERLMDAYKRESECDIVATSEDLGLLTMAALKMDQAARIIELLRYRHDTHYSRES